MAGSIKSLEMVTKFREVILTVLYYEYGAISFLKKFGITIIIISLVKYLTISIERKLVRYVS